MKVESDEEAVADERQPYGLTAAIWTRDEAAAVTLGDHIETGTCS